MSLREELKQFSKWAGFVAILTIIGGGLSAITGLFAFIIGAIPGIIMIIVGIKLWKAKKEADEIVNLDGAEYESRMYTLISNLTSYFKIQGILFIVMIALYIIGFIVMMTIGASMLHSMPQF